MARLNLGPRLSKIAQRTEYLHDGMIVKTFDRETMHRLHDYHKKMKRVVENAKKNKS